MSDPSRRRRGGAGNFPGGSPGEVDVGASTNGPEKTVRDRSTNESEAGKGIPANTAGLAATAPAVSEPGTARDAKNLSPVLAANPHGGGGKSATFEEAAADMATLAEMIDAENLYRGQASDLRRITKRWGL